MHTLEITIRARSGDTWPVVVNRFISGDPAPTRREGTLGLVPGSLSGAGASETGMILGHAVFRDEVLRTFNESLTFAEDDGLHVLLHVEDRELRKERWERLTAPMNGGWNPLATNQRTPFSLHLPSATDRRFPPISRHDLRALIVVASPTNPEGWGFPPSTAPRLRTRCGPRWDRSPPTPSATAWTGPSARRHSTPSRRPSRGRRTPSCTSSPTADCAATWSPSSRSSTWRSPRETSTRCAPAN